MRDMKVCDVAYFLRKFVHIMCSHIYFTIMQSTEVWNINILITSWLGFGLSSYLVGSLILASEEQMKGVVVAKEHCGYDTIKARNADSNHPTVLTGNHPPDEGAAHDGEDRNKSAHEYVETCSPLWFMMLSFSSALAAFAISTRVGDACIGMLSSTPYCKRSALGAGIGLTCALLSCIVLMFYILNRQNDINRGKNLHRIDGLLSGLVLVLQSINLGFGANPSGPSTEMGNIYIASASGVV